jgi:DNA-directed RNA polymerase subunit RPC12/RpoP
MKPRMIIFKCPECREEMEIPERMVGSEVRCVECGERVLVPAPRRLTGSEWLLFALLFFFIPAANVLVSSILYYVWKSDHPERARQINLLGFLIFGLHGLIGVLVLVLAEGFKR